MSKRNSSTAENPDRIRRRKEAEERQAAYSKLSVVEKVSLAGTKQLKKFLKIPEFTELAAARLEEVK